MIRSFSTHYQFYHLTTWSENQLKSDDKAIKFTISTPFFGILTATNRSFVIPKINHELDVVCDDQDKITDNLMIRTPFDCGRVNQNMAR
jgi:hypothetical protein